MRPSDVAAQIQLGGRFASQTWAVILQIEIKF